MSAGQPNWQKLHEQGKLPKDQHGRIPGLAKLESAEQRLEEIKNECCDDCRTKFFSEQKDKDQSSVVTVKCEAEGCEYLANGKSEGVAKNVLRLHSKSHEKKDN